MAEGAVDAKLKLALFCRGRIACDRIPLLRSEYHTGQE